MFTAIRTAIFGLVCLSAAATSPADIQPALKPAHAIVSSGDAQAPECKEALLLAQSMPHSKGPNPLTRLELPRGMRSTVALGPPTDKSEPSILMAADDFDELQLPRSERAYWSNRVEAGKRIAVTTSPRGEKEKRYSLYLLDASLSLTDFLAETQKFGGSLRPFVADQWPPLLFHLPSTDTTWWLYMGPQEHRKQTWDVYARPVSRHVCRITLYFSTSVALTEILI